MAVVGHWNTLADAQELTQSMLLQGVIQTVIEAGQLVSMLPIKQISGKDLLYNREDSWTASAGASFFDIREQIPWSSDVTYTPVTVPLKRIARQDPIDNFVRSTYNSINDYSALMIQQLAKRMTRFMEHHVIYGDVTYGGSKQFDGIHALAEEGSGDLDIDQAEGALSLANLRKMLDAAKVDTEADGNGASGRSNVVILVPRSIGRRLDAGVQEGGFVRSSVTHSMGQLTFSRNEFGARITLFDGIPIIRSDFLVAEQANTGVGSDARAARTSGTNMYTVFVIRFGQTEDGGLSMLFGGDSADVGDLFKRTHFDVLENYDSGGERLVAYSALALGAGHSIGRIFDITDAEIIP